MQHTVKVSCNESRYENSEQWLTNTSQIQHVLHILAHTVSNSELLSVLRRERSLHYSRDTELDQSDESEPQLCWGIFLSDQNFMQYTVVKQTATTAYEITTLFGSRPNPTAVVNHILHVTSI